MSENKKSIDVKSWGTATAVISAYATIIAILFQYGFWIKFNINPLSYIAFSEVATSIFIIIAPVSALVAIIVTPLHFAMLLMTKNIIRKTPKYSNLIKRKVIIYFIVGLFLGVVALLALSLFLKNDMIGFLIKFSLIIFVISIAFNIPLLIKSIPDEFFRFSILCFLCITPPLCYWVGELYSNLILKNELYSFIPANYVPESIKKISDDKDIKYIGKIGEHIFLSSLDNKTLIVMLETDISPLILKEYESN